MKVKLPVVTAVMLAMSVAETISQTAERQKSYNPCQLRPVDEGATDPGFRSFRVKLMDAIAHKDVNFLLSVIDPRIKNSFAGDDGIEAFQKIWKPRDSGTKIWTELYEVLRLGGSFTKAKREFWAPYVFSRFPDRYDGFSYSAIIAKDAKVRDAPKKSAPVITVLSYDVVQTSFGDSKFGDSEKAKSAMGWTRVRLPDGREGFVNAKSIRSPIDYRAGFKRTGDKWMLTQFVAGD